MPKIIVLPAILIILIGIFVGNLYQKSNELKNKGDILASQNKLQEALLFYKEAQSAFPLRSDIANDVSGTQLLINSALEYSQIVDETYAEIQEILPLERVSHVQLKENEFFVPILMYHHIRINPKPEDPVWAALNVTADQLDAELNFLTIHNYHVISLDDLHKAFDKQTTLPENPIILTFDDGYKNFYENAYPLLKKYKMKAIEFVITDVQTAPAYLSWAEIEEMNKSGLIEFGAHTQHHPNLPDLSTSLIDKEITKSKSDLENHLSKSIKWFAYPYGSYSSYILAEVARVGFIGAVSTIYSGVQSKDKLFLLPRIMVDGRFSLDDFAKRIQK